MQKMSTKIAVVIPCYQVKDKIFGVIDLIDQMVSKIYVVDDCCPQNTGDSVNEAVNDDRVVVLKNVENLGVGGSVIEGYKAALADGMDIVVKIDGDGQMDPQLLGAFVRPIIEGRADYTKGNRFYNIDGLSDMPRIRLFGNAVLSFLNKAVSGYWNIMDPTNGYTAISAGVLNLLPLDKIERRYFFESDMLFRLGAIRACVIDVPMSASYSDEKSHLNIMNVIKTFPSKYLLRFIKRLFYNYYLRDFNVASISLLSGIALLLSGCYFGSIYWYSSYISGVEATSGQVMIAALQLFIGFQLLLVFINYDIMSVPRECLWRSFKSQ